MNWIKPFYSKWCKDTKRNGGILISSSIRELMEAIDEQIVTPIQSKQTNHIMENEKNFTLQDMKDCWEAARKGTNVINHRNGSLIFKEKYGEFEDYFTTFILKEDEVMHKVFFGENIKRVINTFKKKD